MLSMILNILLLSVSVFFVAQLLPGVRVKSFGTGVKVAVVYSLVDFFLFKLLVFLSFPFLLISFGLFVVIINSFLLWLTDAMLDDFEIDGFGTTILASILISACNFLLKLIF